MIEVRLGQTSLTVRGHAGFARYGSDIVCAAASMLAYTLAQAARNLSREPMVECASGAFRLRIAPRDDERARVAVMMQTIQAGYWLLAARYPAYVRVMSEEGSENKSAKARKKPEEGAEGGNENEEGSLAATLCAAAADGRVRAAG